MFKEKLQWFEESLLEVRKVTKVTTGWRRMRFRATVLVGDRGGNIGIWVGKGNDVAIAVSKATHDAYKNIKQVPITLSGSIPYQVNCKYKSCLVTLRPAGSGTGLKAWSSVRIALELAGYSNILSKIIGSNNSLNNAIAVITALVSFKVNVDKVQKSKELVKGAVEKKDDKRGNRDNRDRKDSPRKPVAPKAMKSEEKVIVEKIVVKAPEKAVVKAPEKSEKKVPEKSEKKVAAKKPAAKKPTSTEKAE